MDNTPQTSLRASDWVGSSIRNLFEQLDAIENIMDYHKLYDEFEDHASRISQKRKDLADPAVYVFVFGKGKFGKSSLINQLLGRDVAKTSAIPMTWRIDFFRPLTEEQARNSGGEFAEILRAKSKVRERMSIDEAQNLCNQQERDVLKHMRKREKEKNAATMSETTSTGVSEPNSGLAVEDQIIEVNWYYENLALPTSIVLVDTPGLFQDRGSMKSQTQVFSSTEGVVFESPDAAYEYYYPRADVVLWLFRADLLKDRDTRDALRQLSEQRKSILGVVTHLDALSSPREQQDAMQQLKQEYGAYVDGFLPVITGGESPSVGQGVLKVRETVERLGPRARQIKIEAAKRFITYITQCCERWLLKKGTVLIGNITKIAIYCDLTSDVLLKEVKTCHDILQTFMDQEIMPRRESVGLNTLMMSILRDEVPHQPEFNRARSGDAQAKTALQFFYQKRMSKELGLDSLHRDAQDKLKVATDRMIAAGKQAAAGRRLEQVILKSGGRAESKPLESIIHPPDVSRLAVSLPPIAIPYLSVSLYDSILDFFGGTRLGGLMRRMGWKSTDEKQAPLLLQARAATISAIETLPRQITQTLTTFTKDAAAAVVDGADEAIRRIYVQQDLHRLKTEASRLDQDLKDLREIAIKYTAQQASQEQQTETRSFSFEMLYTLWSPRDNARTAVIKMFCHWFEGQQDNLRFKAQEWYRQNVTGTIAKDVISHYCHAYLKQTQQQDGMTKHVLISSLETTQPRGGLTNHFEQWVDSTARSIRNFRLWDDEANFLGVDYEHFQLNGISHDMSCVLADNFAINFRGEMYQQTFHIRDSDLMKKFDAQTEVYNPPTLKRAGVVALASSLVVDPFLHHAWLLNHLSIPARLLLVLKDVSFDFGVGLLVSITGIVIIHNARKAASIGRRRRQLVSLLAESIQHAAVTTASLAFTEATTQLDPKLARDLIGNKTLVKKRALDYASEGQFLTAPLNQK